MLRGNENRKKLLVFLCRLNPLWRQLYDLERQLPRGRGIAGLTKANPFRAQRHPLPDRTPERCEQARRRIAAVAHLEDADLHKSAGPRQHLLDLSHETIRKWRSNASRGEPERQQRALAYLCHVLKLMETSLPTAILQEECGDLRLMVDEYARALADESVDVYSAGRIFGMDMPATQKAIDTVVHGESPLLALAYYPTDTHARTDLVDAELGGLYELWIRRGDFWMQCAVQVRYSLAVADQPIIRAKLHVPNLVHDDPAGRNRGAHWEYDGFVRVLASKAYWVFEKRMPAQADFMFFVSSRSDMKYRNKAVHVGQYLTLGQDTNQSTASGMAIFNRVEGLPESDEAARSQRKRMFETPRQLPADDPRTEFLAPFIA